MENTKGKGPECPHCGAHDSISGRLFCLAGGFGGGTCLGFLFLVLFFPLAPVVVIIGYVVGFLGIFVPKRVRVCSNCKKKFEV